MGDSPFKMTESALVSATIKWLWAHGIKARRQNSGAFKPEGSKHFVRFGKKGAGDIIAVLPPSGRYLEVECKVGKNKQSPEQIEHQRQIEADGGLYILAYSLDDLEGIFS